jgi:hypothetical protein
MPFFWLNLGALGEVSWVCQTEGPRRSGAVAPPGRKRDCSGCTGLHGVKQDERNSARDHKLQHPARACPEAHTFAKACTQFRQASHRANGFISFHFRRGCALGSSLRHTSMFH